MRSRMCPPLQKIWQMSFECFTMYSSSSIPTRWECETNFCEKMLSKSWQIYPKSPLKLCYLFIRSGDNNSQLSLVTSSQVPFASLLMSNAPIHSGYIQAFSICPESGGSVLLFRTLRIMTDRTYTAAAVLWHESILKQRSQYLQIINFIHKE